VDRSRSLGRGVRRGELWLAKVGNKTRPVLVMTRSEVIDVRALVTVAEVTTSIRGLASEVNIDHVEAGLDRPSVINCDGIHTVAQQSLTTLVGQLGDDVLRQVCAAVSYALGC
jgi:mRNA-degrading endonuclease toxin of MazEF toxin-antitoxin module